MGRGRRTRRIRAFGKIAVSGQNNVVADRKKDTLTLVGGTNITIATNAADDSVTITASGDAEGEANQNAFSTIAVSGQSNVVADSETDTLTLAAGTNITITTNAGSDTVTITGNVSYINNKLLLVGYDNSGNASSSDLGVIFKRGGVNNQALVWDESVDEFAFIETTSDQSTSGEVNITAYAPVKALTYITPSSLRLKENIVEIDNPIEKLKKLRGVYFDWKETGERDIGFIAEEIGKIIPEIVSYEDEENALGLDYSRITSLLLESIKEQQEIIDKQEKKINFLYNFLKLSNPTKT
jgi:hypothetical protein